MYFVRQFIYFYCFVLRRDEVALWVLYEESYYIEETVMVLLYLCV